MKNAMHRKAKRVADRPGPRPTSRELEDDKVVQERVDDRKTTATKKKRRIGPQPETEEPGAEGEDVGGDSRNRDHQQHVGRNDEVGAETDRARKGAGITYHVCGRRADGQAARITTRPTLGQARRCVETCRELMGGQYGEFWLERVQRFEV